MEPRNWDHGDRARVNAVRVDYSSGAEREISIDDDPTPASPFNEVQLRIRAMMDVDEDNFRTAQTAEVASKL